MSTGDIKIFFIDEQMELRVHDPTCSILDVALHHGLSLDHSCGGNGSCGTCRIIVDNVNCLPPRNEIEREMAEDRQFDENERLACQTTAINGVRFTLDKKRL